MSKITKEMVLENLEQVKSFIQEAETKKEEKVIGIAIKNRFTGEIIFQSTKITYRDAIIEKGDKNLSGADLSNADLSNAYLSGANLCSANLSDANLSGADLSNADLSNADLSNADLSNADLRGANLSDAELNCAIFYGKGGTIVINKANLEGFLGALGFILRD